MSTPIPQDASPALQQYLRDLDARLLKWESPGLPIDLRGRRVINAGRSQQREDYVTKGEVTDLVSGVQPGAVSSVQGSCVALVERTGETATIAGTVLYVTQSPELYVCSVYCVCTTAGAAGTCQAAISWTDLSGITHTLWLTGTVDLTALGDYFQQTIVLRADAGSAITYQTAVAGGAGGPVYAIYIGIQKVRP